MFRFVLYEQIISISSKVAAKSTKIHRPRTRSVVLDVVIGVTRIARPLNFVSMKISGATFFVDKSP